jgi:hypothetical protein
MRNVEAYSIASWSQLYDFYRCYISKFQDPYTVAKPTERKVVRKSEDQYRDAQ